MGRSLWGWRWLALAVCVRASDAAAARLCSSLPVVLRDAALQSSVRAGQERSNSASQQVQHAHASRVCACLLVSLLLASVLQDASQRARAQLFLRCRSGFGARRRCDNLALHNTPAAQKAHSTASRSNLSTAHLLCWRADRWRHRHRANLLQSAATSQSSGGVVAAWTASGTGVNEEAICRVTTHDNTTAARLSVPARPS